MALVCCGAERITSVPRVDGAERDEWRREVAARGLTRAAVAHLARDALARIEFDHLAPVKSLLKQFFSDAPWATADDDALAALVGSGEGWWRHALDDEIEFAFGWNEDTFRLELARTATASRSSDGSDACRPLVLGDSFAGTIVPEATPNPRTIRFVTGVIHTGSSRWYESAAQVDDARVARLFGEFDDVANVLVGPDFVAVGIRRADRWEQLLAPMLRVLEEAFGTAASAASDEDRSRDVVTSPGVDVRATSVNTGDRAFDRAWRELRRLRLDQPDDVERLLAAASSEDVETRQVAARVLVDADQELAIRAWAGLLDDPSRTVRRATVDAMVDAARPMLRPLLERALADRDPWTRWKALRGLVDLGMDPSRNAVTALLTDADFRVRLEATTALRNRDPA
jgi:hypothetical protein